MVPDPHSAIRSVEAEATGRRGKKKRLEIDHAEAAIVRQVFKLYEHGAKGIPLGVKGTAAYLNDHGMTMRGQHWTKGKVHNLLANTAYCGEYIFNRMKNKTREEKDNSEWIKIAIEPIIDAPAFERARAHRAARAPTKVPPRIVNSPTLLTGLLKCGICGAGMTLATGKGGRYRYYKCQSRIAKGNKVCDSQNIPMLKLDELVLNALGEKVFTAVRVKSMIAALQKQQIAGGSDHDEAEKRMTKELNELKRRSDRLFDAVESGFLPSDSALQQRAHKIQARRQEVLVEIAAIKRQTTIPVKLLRVGQAEVFAKVLKAKLMGSRPFAKQYLLALVSQVRLTGRIVEMQGSYQALASAVAKNLGTLGAVPRFTPNWLPDLGSNQGHTD